MLKTAKSELAKDIRKHPLSFVTVK